MVDLSFAAARVGPLRLALHLLPLVENKNDFSILRPRCFINYKISCALHISAIVYASLVLLIENWNTMYNLSTDEGERESRSRSRGNGSGCREIIQGDWIILNLLTSARPRTHTQNERTSSWNSEALASPSSRLLVFSIVSDNRSKAKVQMLIFS